METRDIWFVIRKMSFAKDTWIERGYQQQSDLDDMGLARRNQRSLPLGENDIGIE